MKGVLNLFAGFRENKMQLPKGVETAAFPPDKPLAGTSFYHDIHHIFVSLIEEMDGKQPAKASSAFRADLLLTAFRSDI
ncbi:hypothetical protein [Paenibacillus yonginensis]|nr:hypothetical protein [Paenibacillus yonginensis]